ncbi:MAG: hypothetical protein KC609_06420 [Myxococcales bacterium]|nr:hypothetical protein [Myxococcales bacterium]
MQPHEQTKLFRRLGALARGAALFALIVSSTLPSCRRRPSDPDDQPKPEVVAPPPVMPYYLRSLKKELNERYRRPAADPKLPIPLAAPHYRRALELLLALPKKEQTTPADPRSAAILDELRKGGRAATGRSPFALGGNAHAQGWKRVRALARALVGLLRASAEARLAKGDWLGGVADAIATLRVSHDFRRGANLVLWTGLVRDENAFLDRLGARLSTGSLPAAALTALRDGLALLERTMPTYLDALRLNALVMEGKFTSSFDKQWKPPAGLLSPREQTAARLQDVARNGKAIATAWIFSRVLQAKLQKDLAGKAWVELERGLLRVEAKLAQTKKRGPTMMIRSLRSTTRRAVSPRQRMRLLRVACELLLSRGAKGRFPAQLSELKLAPKADDPATDKPFVLRVEGAGVRLESPRDLGFDQRRQKKSRGPAPRLILRILPGA